MGWKNNERVNMNTYLSVLELERMKCEINANIFVHAYQTFFLDFNVMK